MSVALTAARAPRSCYAIRSDRDPPTPAAWMLESWAYVRSFDQYRHGARRYAGDSRHRTRSAFGVRGHEKVPTGGQLEVPTLD